MHGEDELKKISIYSKANISYTKDENGFNVCPFPLCDYKSKETGNLKRHYARIHKNIELDKIAPKSKQDKHSKKCHLCDFSSKFNSNLRNHIVRSHGKSELDGSSKQVGEQTSQNEPDNYQKKHNVKRFRNDFDDLEIKRPGQQYSTLQAKLVVETIFDQMEYSISVLLPLSLHPTSSGQAH